jgi:cyclophilin family peptidyl-prolyl cis-trans isomerase
MRRILRQHHFRLPLIFLLTAATAQAGTLAQFRTVIGNVEVELYDQQKPITTENFKRLVQSGEYQNTFFQRVVPGFVAQGGGYFTFVRNATNLFAPTWDNLGVVPDFGPISNEFNVGPLFSNTNGTLAMAKLGGNPNSATREWFFNLNNNATNLDNQNGGFTVFGHVVRDTGPTNTGGVLGFFNLISYGNFLVNMQSWYPTDNLATNVFQTLPVTYFGTNQPRYVDLFYVDISLLSVQITVTNNERQISWTSVNGKTNIVEFTTAMPPVWQQLLATNGNGNRYIVADATATNTFRFYRVKIIY